MAFQILAASRVQLSVGSYAKNLVEFLSFCCVNCKHMFLLLTSHIDPQETRLYNIWWRCPFHWITRQQPHGHDVKTQASLAGVPNSNLIVPELFKRLVGARGLININITSEDLPLLKLVDVEEVLVIQSEMKGAHVLFHPVLAEALRNHAHSSRYSPLECNLRNIHIPYHVTTASWYAWLYYFIRGLHDGAHFHMMCGLGICILFLL